MSKPPVGAARMRLAKQPETWAEWRAKRDTLATRADIEMYVNLYDEAIRARLPDLIAEQRWYRRLIRWVKSRFSRPETHSPARM